MSKEIRKICYFFAILITLIMILYFAIFVTDGIGYSAIMLPLTPLGLVSFLYTEKKDYCVFKGYLIGIGYALCMNLASNNGIYVIANASAVSSSLSLILIYSYLKENKQYYYRVQILGLIIALQLFSEVYVMMNHVFWEKGPGTLTCEIEEGPLKGILTTKEKKRYLYAYI